MDPHSFCLHIQSNLSSYLYTCRSNSRVLLTSNEMDTAYVYVFGCGLKSFLFKAVNHCCLLFALLGILEYGRIIGVGTGGALGACAPPPPIFWVTNTIIIPVPPPI